MHTSATHCQVLIILPPHSGRAEAFLLSSAGEEKENYVLHAGHNHIPLKHHAPGTYALRIETENDVTVRQIILPPSS